MRNRMTKLATAAIIVIAVFIGIRGFNGATAWAKVVKAINSANDIHVLARITRANGQVEVHKSWLKNRTMLREEHPEDVIIDDGENRLVLDLEENTAQFSDSHSSAGDLMETGGFEIILLFRGHDTPYQATELPHEHTDTMHVFGISYRDTWKGKAWVDAETNLPMRISATPTEKHRDRVSNIEITYDYQPIPLEKFNLIVPEGYTEIPRAKSRVLSGKVVDEEGRPVAGADIVTSHWPWDIHGKTNENGDFSVHLHPKSSSLGLPVLIRAFKADDPDRLAWTLIRNPGHEPKPDGGRRKIERGSGLHITVVDEEQLRAFIPPDPGRIICEDGPDGRPIELRDILLKMAPASVITGQLTDPTDQPIANAVVWVEYIVIEVGKNEIRIDNFGNTAEESEMISLLDREVAEQVDGGKAFAVTDAHGRYEIGHLPDAWYRARLQAWAKGMALESRVIFHEDVADFALLEAGITIRGTVIDNHGQPLIGHKVEINIETDDETDFDIEDVMVDAQGRFELTGVPAVDRLELQVRSDEKPVYWDRNDLTRDREFTHYLMVEEPVTFEPGKKEYVIDIVLQRPDITLEIEVKDSKGKPLKGIPVGISSPGFSERVWYLTKLNGTTDENGLCTIKEVPNIRPLNLWVAKPPERQMYLWEQERKVNQDTKSAIIECGGKYPPKVVTVEVEGGKKEYKITVIL